ncbi:MAG: ATP-binding protein [Gammaproteobacteria bacterium]
MDEGAKHPKLQLVESRSQIGHAHALADLGGWALHANSPHELQRRAVELVAASLQLNHALIAEFDPASGRLRLVDGIAWEKSVLQGIVSEIDVHWRQALSRPREDSERLPFLSPRLMHRYGLAANIFETIPASRRHLGLIAGFSVQHRVFHASERQFLRAVANILGLAIARRPGEPSESAAEHHARDKLPDLVCVLDKDGNVVDCPSASLWVADEPPSLAGKNIHDLLHPHCVDDDCALASGFRQAWYLIAETRLAKWSFFDTTAGRHLWFSIRRTRKRRLPKNGHARLLVRDLGNGKRLPHYVTHYSKELQARLYKSSLELADAREQLKRHVDDHVSEIEAFIELERKYASLMQSSLTGVYLAREGTIMSHNWRFSQMLGYGKQRLHGADIAKFLDFDTGAMDSPAAQQEGPEQVVVGITRENDRKWLRLNEVALDIRGRSIVLGNVLDISVQMKVEETLRQSEHELRALSSRLITAQETERKRIASELHDGLGQSMSAIKFGIENILQELDGQVDGQPIDKLGALVAKIRDSIEEVRRISMDLRPSTLDDLGVVATIAWSCREFQAVMTGIEIVKRIEVEEDDIHTPLKLVIFRILQEALNNIAKHASADRIYVGLTKTDDEIRLCIEDNGQGFARHQVAWRGSGLGLKSMQERAELLGGKLSTLSVQGAGTVVKAVWPFDPSAGGRLASGP